MTDLILAQQAERIARARRLSHASDRALALSERAKKRLTLLTNFGGSARNPTTGGALLRAAYSRSVLASRLNHEAIATLTGAR